MKKLLLAFIALAMLTICINGAQATKPPPSPSPSPIPSSTPSPGPEGCGTGFQHLGSGGKLTLTGTAVTTYMAPIPDNRVFVYVGVATSGDALTPVLTGEGVTWELVGTWYKDKNGLPGLSGPRNLSLFTAMNAVPGTLVFSGLPTPKTHITWSVSQAGQNIVQLAVNPTGGLETSHSVTLDNPPVGAVLAGFLIGQQAAADDVPPYVTLGQGHTSLITTVSEWDIDGPGDYQTASVVWPQPGHSIGAAVEVVCE